MVLEIINFNFTLFILLIFLSISERPCSLPNKAYYVNLTNKCKKVSFDMRIVSNCCEIIIQCDADSLQSQSTCVNGTWMPQLPLSCFSLGIT